jgi:uncharacterized membrane protein YqgA involved in biofilm formation
MTGTVINVIAIIVGSSIGILVGNRLSRKMQESVITGLGLVTLVIGVQNAMRSGNIIIPLLSLLLGAIIGELLGVDDALKRLGGWLQAQAARVSSAADDLAHARIRFVNGFVTASLVFCIGPLAILGSIQNGINSGDTQLLVIKSTLDFFASIAFAASLGVGVAFSAIPTAVLQGSFALFGIVLAGVFASAQAGALNASNPYIREMTATGGLLLIGLTLVLLDIKQPRVANYLPALLIAPLLVGLAGALGINIYPL